MSFTSWLRMLHFVPSNRVARIVCAAATALAAITLAAPSSSAAYVNVFGGPTYAPGVGGFQGGSVTGVNDAGTVVGNADKYDGSDVNKGSRAVRWDGSGSPATELANLGTNAGGVTNSYAFAINNAGTAVGQSDRYSSLDAYQYWHPVRWDASGTAATELDDNALLSSAVAINDTGTAVGGALFEDFNSSAVRWDGSGTGMTVLDGEGNAISPAAVAINNGGTAVGSYNIEFGGFFLYFPVRWDGSGTAATYLWGLGGSAAAVAINDAGTAVGYSEKYNGGSDGYNGTRAVRWDASGTAATELDYLGLDTNDVTQSGAVAINDAGTAIGYANLYDSSGETLGRRAVRWDASGTAATELGNLGTNGEITETDVFAINDAGIAVGYADDYDGSGTILGERAVYWGLDAVAVDLNTLIDPLSGWTLNRATAISNTGWIGGSGAFDPDGAGGQEAYARLFLIQIPEPSDLPGDYNQNGIVGPEDYDVWKANFGSTAFPDADGNGDGTVNTADYTVWRNHLGNSLGAGSGAALPSAAPLSPAVPEPATLILFLVGLLAMFSRQRATVS